MYNLCKKLLNIFIYLISIVALIIIFIGFIKSGNYNYIDINDKNKIERFTLDIYKFIDNGKFENLYDIVLEGKWEPNNDKINGQKKIYIFKGIIDKNNFLKQNIDDFGYNGWRINFNSLKIINIEKIDLQIFMRDYHKEWLILENYKNINNNLNIYIVTIKGYTIGSCSIVDWEKKLPIFFDGKYWKAIVTGTPEDLKSIHREQWLTEINFNSD